MRILIGAPVRQDHQTFYKYLKAIRQLDTQGIKVDLFFILHNSPRLKRFLKSDEYIEYVSDNDYIRNDIGHHWTNQNLNDVTKMKNMLLSYCLCNQYDYFFLVDSDIILQPQTLQVLLSRKKDIIAEVFWTKWEQFGEEMPNAWQADFYAFKTEREWEQWREEGLYKVGMTGACILIKNKVLKSGVNYTPIPNVSHSIWEDRAFCIRAAVHGHEIWLDTTCPPVHLYRPKNKPSKNKAKQMHEIK